MHCHQQEHLAMYIMALLQDRLCPDCSHLCRVLNARWLCSKQQVPGAGRQQEHEQLQEQEQQRFGQHAAPGPILVTRDAPA